MWQLSIICVAFSAIYARHVTNGMDNSVKDKVQIIGGYDIDIREAPYQVSIIEKSPELNNSWEHACGGSIIAKDIILTAAHCLYGRNLSAIQVRVGSTYWKTGGLIVPVANLTYNSNFSYAKLDYDVGLVKLSTPLEFSDTVKPIAMINDGEKNDDGAITNGTANLTCNSNYSSSVMDYDVGLLKLSAPLEFSETVKPIDMMEDGAEINDGAIVNVTGWGVIADVVVYKPSPILQKVSVQKVNYETCRSLIAKAYGADLVTRNMICTGVRGGGKAPCHGDSGGPLVHKGKLVGVVSFGTRYCDNPIYPSVYAKVSAFRSWIDDTMKHLTDEHGSII